MKVEFTKKLTGYDNPFRDIRIAINEREDNLSDEDLNDEKRQLREEIKTNPNYCLHSKDYKLLFEMAAQAKKLWKPNKELTVFFFGGQDERTKQVLDYASIWSDHCSIRFAPTTKKEEAKIRVAFQEPSSWSYIGTDASLVPPNEPTINFGWLDSNLLARDYKQVVLHEFGHALGLIHEHQSPTVEMKWDKYFVYQYFLQHHGWTTDDVDRNLFQEFEKGSTQYSKLDRQSIMGYHIPPEFTFDRQEFPLNYDLSEMDKKYIGQVYPKILHS